MSKEPRSDAVRQYQGLFRILGCIYAVGAALFFFFPDFVITLLNILPAIFEPINDVPLSSEHFWVPLAASMMVMLVILAFAAAANPQNRVYAWVHNASKLCSSLGYLYYFFARPGEDGLIFPYLIGFLTDFPIFVIAAFFTVRAHVSRAPKAKATEPPQVESTE